MIRVTETEWERGDSPRVHDFAEATDFTVGHRGELTILGPPRGNRMAAAAIACFADGSWDTVLVDPPESEPARIHQFPAGPTESSAPSTTGPSTFDQPADIPGPMNQDEADTPGAAPSEAADLVGAPGVMTSEPEPEPEKWQDAYGKVTVTNEMVDRGSLTAQPGLPADDDGNTKVVIDGDGKPVVLRRTATGSWATVSPDDIPVTVPPALIEDDAPAQT